MPYQQNSEWPIYTAPLARETILSTHTLLLLHRATHETNFSALFTCRVILISVLPHLLISVEDRENVASCRAANDDKRTRWGSFSASARPTAGWMSLYFPPQGDIAQKHRNLAYNIVAQNVTDDRSRVQCCSFCRTWNTVSKFDLLTAGRTPN